MSEVIKDINIYKKVMLEDYEKKINTYNEAVGEFRGFLLACLNFKMITNKQADELMEDFTLGLLSIENK